MWENGFVNRWRHQGKSKKSEGEARQFVVAIVSGGACDPFVS